MVEFLVSWGPFLLIAILLIGIGVQQMRRYEAHVNEVKHINDELIELTREMAAELREIKQILKDRT